MFEGFLGSVVYRAISSRCWFIQGWSSKSSRSYRVPPDASLSWITKRSLETPQTGWRWGCMEPHTGWDEDVWTYQSLFNTSHTIHHQLNLPVLSLFSVYSVFWLHVLLFELTLSPRSPLGPAGPVMPRAPGLPCKFITSTTRLHVERLGFGS